MTKSRPFSIYLLKQGYYASNSIREGSNLEPINDANNRPNDASLFLLDAVTGQPWWKSYFGIPKRDSELPLTSKGALVFMPVAERCFVLSFGRVHHKIKDEAFEYDFGLRVTLNCVDPDKLNSTDTHDPGTARRQRTQLPNAADLTLFDIDHDSNILKTLTGKSKEEYQPLFRNATGSNSFKCSTRKTSAELSSLLNVLLELYKSDAYLNTFPNIRNVVPVNDPTIIDNLNKKLLLGLKQKHENLYLTLPDLIDYHSQLFTKFTGFYGKSTYEELYLDNYYRYLDERNKSLTDLTLANLQSHRVQQLDEQGIVRYSYQLFKCLVYDTKLQSQDTGKTYHLTEGNWYKADDSYVNEMRTFLDPLCSQQILPNFNHDNEGHYNEDVATQSAGQFICLDRANIAPSGLSQIEPCDLYTAHENNITFYHVKRSTFSQQLSHLFNQGVNSAEAIRMLPDSTSKLADLVKEKSSGISVPNQEDRFKVQYAIITHKDPSKKSENLPFFSGISLMRTMKQLKLMGLDCGYEFVKDTKQSVSSTDE